MARWLQLPVSGPERDKLDRDAAAEVHRRVEMEMVGGTIRPEDQRHEPGRADVLIVAGKKELLALASETLEKSAAYAAVNTMQAQPFMLTLRDGTKATVPSSAGHWLEVERHRDATEARVAGTKAAAQARVRHRG